MEARLSRRAWMAAAVEAASEEESTSKCRRYSWRARTTTNPAAHRSVGLTEFLADSHDRVARIAGRAVEVHFDALI